MTTTCLAVNTATSALSVALVAGEKVLYLFEGGEMRDQGNLLLAHAQKALDAAGMGYADIGRLAVVTGPGSFTGIRIGLAAVRGLALATGRPVAGVDSFAMFAPPQTPHLVAVESWREELYFRYTGPDGQAVTANETPAAFAARIATLPPPRFLAGDAAGKVVAVFPDAERVAEVGNAVTVARLALNASLGEKPVPYYLRAADVTVKKP